MKKISVLHPAALRLTFLSLLLPALLTAGPEDGTRPPYKTFSRLKTSGPADPAVQTLRFVQDDAQDYMVSKIYVLRYAQANDLNPFLSSMVKRYNMNSVVNCIEYGSSNQQILTVTCPTGMMPYVDDFIRKADRPVRIRGKIPGEIIRGTGITRAVYRPLYRSGQTLVNIIVNAIINAGPYGSVYGWDANSNQIYWKDNTSNSEFMYQFLGFLDRPAPQIHIEMNVVEVRESTLRDIGLDYLAWKNGPGLNLFQAAWQAFDVSSGGTAAIQAMSGPMGGFFFAPQFDASFLRILQQNGKADLRNTASLTVSNSETASYDIFFNPQLQNIVKSENDQSDVGISAAAADGTRQIWMQVQQPIVCIHSGSEVDFSIPNYEPGEYSGQPGTLFFGYSIMAASAVERNSYGAELVESSSFSGNVTMELNKEIILAVWDRDQKVEQTIGAPFLSRIPILKYLFGTTTTSTEKIRVCLTAKATLAERTKSDVPAGILKKIK